MATRYLVATGTWDASNTAIWSAASGGAPGASVPTGNDAVVMDAASGAVTVTLGANVPFGTLTLTGFTGTVAGAGYVLASALNSNTLFTGATTCTITGPLVLNLTYAGAVGTRTINGAATTEANAVSIRVTAGTDNISTTASTNFRDIDFTGFSGTVGNTARTVYGNWNSGTASFTAGGNATTFAATSGTQTITSNGVTLDFPVIVNAPGATVQLADALTLGSTRTFTHTAGGLDLSGFNLTAGAFDSSNANIRSITSGGGQFYVTASGTPWTTLTTTNLTMVDRATINSTNSSASARTISVGSLVEARAPNVNITAGTGMVSGLTPVNNLNFTGFSGALAHTTRTIYGSPTFSPTMTAASGTQATTFAATSGIQVITSNGVTLDFPITVNAPGATVQLADALTLGSTRAFTHTAGGLNLNGYNLTSGSFSSSNANVRSITSGAGQFFCTIFGASGSSTPINMGTITNLTMVDRPTFNVTGNGSGTATRSMQVGALAEAVCPNINVTAGTDTISTLNTNFGTVNFTGFSGTLSNGTRNIYGNWTSGAGMTYTAGASATTFAATSGTQVITSNGVTLDFPVTVNAPGATVQLADALTVGSGRILTLTAGTFTANNFNVSAGNFVSTGAATRALNMGSGTWTILGVTGNVWSVASTGMTLNPGTSTILMSGATAKTFQSGGLTYYNLSQAGAGALTISFGPTLNDLQNTVTPATITLSASTTTTVSALSLQGTAGNLVTLQSSSAGTAATLSKASGTVDVSFLSIKDSAATGGATWQARTNFGNVDAGNNTGWNFAFRLVGGNPMIMSPGMMMNR